MPEVEEASSVDPVSLTPRSYLAPAYANDHVARTPVCVNFNDLENP
jgi:hypothetical protein